jgi:hypothetical protein
MLVIVPVDLDQLAHDERTSRLPVNDPPTTSPNGA